VPDLVITLAERPPLRLTLHEDELAALGPLTEPIRARAALALYLGLDTADVPSHESVSSLGAPVRSRVREVLLAIATDGRWKGRRSGAWEPDVRGVKRVRRTLTLGHGR
jgi:hypothetical protein